MSEERYVLPISGWSLRTVRSSTGRPALEVHSPTGLVDVSVMGPFSGSPLRGGRHSGRSVTRWSLAWGHLPSGADVVEASFRGWRRSLCVQACTVADAFWVAEVGERFRSVTCSAGATLVTMPVTPAPRPRGRRQGLVLVVP